MIIFKWITQYLAVFTLLGSCIAFLWPPSFLIFEHVFLWLFAAAMLALGVVLDPDDLRQTLRSPVFLVVGVAMQFSIMPLLGYGVARLADLPPQVALGFIIVACAPGAMASNVVVYLAGGAVAFSIALTTLSTLLAPVLTPLLVQRLGGVFMEIPFWPMVFTIVKIVVLPLVGGMLLRGFIRDAIAVVQIIAPGIAALSIIIICSYAIASNAEHFTALAPQVFLYVVLVNALGYLLGWYGAKLFRFDYRRRVAMTIEIGMQNAGLGAALALAHFSQTPQTALPSALFAFWCVLTAAGFSAYLNSRKNMISR